MKDSETAKSASQPSSTSQTSTARSTPGKGSRVTSRYGRRAPIQAKGQTGPLSSPSSESTTEATATSGTSGTGSALPHRAAIETAFGQNHDISGVRAHTDSAANAATESLGANAYAIGDQVAFAGGKADLHTAAHEAAHVVQQRAGVHLSGGVGSAGDPYEQHADAVADRVEKGQSASDLLDAVPGKGGGNANASIQRKAVQFELRDRAAAVNTSTRNKAKAGKQLARTQHEARGVDDALMSDSDFGDIPGFNDMAEDDAGPAIGHDHGYLDDGSGNIDENLPGRPNMG